MDLADIWGQFDSIARSPDEEIDLSRAALLIAATEYRDLNIERELYRLDSLADGVAYRLYDESDPLFHVNTISEYLFDELGFRGNYKDYYDPGNSFLNKVIERRLGIPITLSLLYIEVGRRAGVPLEGVGMPGHFMVQHPDVPDLFIDTFHGGILLSEEECTQRLKQATQGSLTWNPRYLEPVSSRDFIARMLRNLKVIYLQRREYQRVLSTIDRLLALQPQASHERRDRGVVNYRLGNYTEALDDLQDYAASSSPTQDSEAVQRLIEQIQVILRS